MNDFYIKLFELIRVILKFSISNSAINFVTEYKKKLTGKRNTFDKIEGIKLLNKKKSK